MHLPCIYILSGTKFSYHLLLINFIALAALIGTMVTAVLKNYFRHDMVTGQVTGMLKLIFRNSEKNGKIVVLSDNLRYISSR